jgi:hypothetical protein
METFLLDIRGSDPLPPHYEEGCGEKSRWTTVIEKASAEAEAYLIPRTELLGRNCFAGIGSGVLAAEAFDAASGIDKLLLAGEKRVALRTDFDVDVALVGGASDEVRAAGALDVNLAIAWVNSFFWHD